jgi:hypothetical protein
MKKLSLVVLLCVFYINAQAQKPFTFGPMVGSGFNIAHTDVDGYKAKANGNFLGGAFARVSIKSFYIQPELYYSNKVANFSVPSYSNPDEQVTTQLKTGNVNVNALLGFRLLKLSGLFNLRVFAGPSTSLIVAKGLYAEGKKSSSVPDMKASSFNVQGGLGVDITKLTIDVRYEQGLTDITNTAEDLKINSVMVVLGFKIL